ncbi:MAG: ScpA family protein [Dehalococcoidia bacterium]
MLPDMFSLSVTTFQGPLDALLGLIDHGELDAGVVPVAAIVRQYALYRAEGSGDAAETAEFVALAARLVLVKSRALLPKPPQAPPIEEEPVDLEAVLAEYRRFKAAAGALREREELGLRSFPRLAPPPAIPPGPGLSNVTLQRLAMIVRNVLARQEEPPSGTVVRETVTIRQKVEQLDQQLRQAGRVSFTAFISASQSRLEVVVAFLAVLELVRRGRAMADQAAPFGDIYIASVAVVAAQPV